MRLHTLALSNFRQHVDTRVEFGPGITGIIGPNGSGKTTILEAIAWAFYGNEAARGRRESIRFARAEPHAPVRVELDFELSGHRYRVVRGLSTAELYLDGGDRPIANSITAVGAMLHRRLGMSRVEFFNTYFTGQKELALMATLGPTERAQFLSRVLGYERLRSAQELARERRRLLHAEAVALGSALPDREAVAASVRAATERVARASAHEAEAARGYEIARAQLAAIGPRWEAAQRERAARQQAAAELRIVEHQLAMHERDRERAAADVARSTEAAQELQSLSAVLAPLDALIAEREALDALARAEGRRQALMEAVRAAEAELAELSTRRAALENAPRHEEEQTLALEAQRRALRDIEAAYETAHTNWVRDRQEAETRRDALRMQYKELSQERERIVEAGEDGVCPTCRRPLGTNFRSVLDLLDDQLDKVKVEGNFFRGRVEQLASPPPTLIALEEQRAVLRESERSLDRRLTSIRADVKALEDLGRAVARKEQQLAGLRADLATLPVGFDAARHETVTREIERLEPLRLRASLLPSQVQRGEVARGELQAAAAAAAAVSRRISELSAVLAQVGLDDAAFDALRAEHSRALDAAQQAQLVLERARGETRTAEEALVRARAEAEDLARREARLADVTRERRLHDCLDEAYTALRSELNLALRPELSKLASEFLSQLTDGRYTELDLDERYNLVVVEDGSAKPVISGGEEDLANLVMRLAISQMIAERAGQSFSLLILDEVFGALDEIRRQHVVDLLRGLQERFEQVVLITHIETIRDGCDQVLSVRYDPATGASVVQRSEASADLDLASVSS